MAAEKNAKRISKICEFLTVCPKLIDANLYRKFWKIHPQFVIDEYRNALAYPNLISGGAASKQQQDKVRMLEEEA